VYWLRGEPTVLTPRERTRYNRQMMVEGWGEEGQLRLKGATVLVAGAGGLGSPAAMYLAVAGVGRIRLCDCDTPELSNLNRQILHDESRIGVNKAVSGKQTLETLNPDVEVVAVTERIGAGNVDDIVADSDVIVDCMDNYPTRYLLNAAAMRKRVPFIHGSVWGTEGRLTTIHHPETPCLQCLFPEAPPEEVFPVVGATPGVIGSLQALEVVKYLVGLGGNLKHRLLVWDGQEAEFLRFQYSRDPACPACGHLEDG